MPPLTPKMIRIQDYRIGSSTGSSGAWPVVLYFTRPRRTSSIEMTVGFLEDVGSTGRAPPCNCRARLAATIMNRYMLCSGSSGNVQWALFLGALSAMIPLALQCLQDRVDLILDP